MEITEGTLGGVDTIRMRTAELDVVVLVGKGSDIYSMTRPETASDPLWKARWGTGHIRGAAQAQTSLVSWLASCPGGWSVLVPSGGAETVVGGVAQPFHGEGSIIPWHVDRVDCANGRARVAVSARLARTALHLTREFEIAEGSSSLRVHDTAVNEGGEDAQLTWTHHPTLGPPFLSEHCRIETNAVRVRIHELEIGHHSPCSTGDVFSWPGRGFDLSQLPPRRSSQRLMSCLDFDPGMAWYLVENADLDSSFYVEWEATALPHAWFFQELDASSGYPWFSNTYIMAIEPSTTPDFGGLSCAIDRGSAVVLPPGQSASAGVTASLGSVDRIRSLLSPDNSARRRDPR